MKRLFLPLSLLLLCLPLTLAAQSAPWSLDDCIDYAMQHNPSLMHRGVEYSLREESLKEASNSRVPVISAGAQETFHMGNTLIMYSIDENLTMSLTQIGAALEMPLITGGRIPNTRTAEEYALKSAAENIAVSKLNLRIRVSAAYLQLLCDKSRQEMAVEQVALCKEQLRSVSKMVDEGVRTGADLSETKAELSAAEHSLTAAEGAVGISKLALAGIMGLEDDSAFDIVAIEGAVTDDDSAPLLPMLENLDNHPAVLSAQYAISSAEYRAKAARGAYYPQLSLFANYNNYFYFPIGAPGIHVGSQLGGNGWGALGLKLAIPILNTSTRAQASKAKLAIEDARVTLAETRMELSRQIREAYFQTITARERYSSALKTEAASKEAYQYRQKTFDAGLATVYELNQSRLQWVSACSQTLQSKYEYLLRKRILAYYNVYGEEN